jgi:hypothetical protein
MGSFTPHRGTHRFISNDTPISWASSLLRGTQCFISVLERTTHPTHGHLPYTGAHNVPSSSQRGTTHPSHGHTQLMGSLRGRLTQSVSWRMSHAAVIINNNIMISESNQYMSHLSMCIKDHYIKQLIAQRHYATCQA